MQPSCEDYRHCAEFKRLPLANSRSDILSYLSPPGMRLLAYVRQLSPYRPVDRICAENVVVSAGMNCAGFDLMTVLE